MVTKYNTMIGDGQKNTSANTCTKYNYPAAIYNRATTKYNCPTAKCNHLTASNHNYISGCLDLQWRTTSDARVYLLEQ